jgi:hypothetical protein
VIRKGSRALQPLPASPDAFVWLRLYQAQLAGIVPVGPGQPLWWTRRAPLRALTYHAARAMFTRANTALGSNWTLHDLRHTAAYRMARDPHMGLTDVQWVLGHAHLSTTQLYVTAQAESHGGAWAVSHLSFTSESSSLPRRWLLWPDRVAGELPLRQDGAHRPVAVHIVDRLLHGGDP